MATGIRCTDLSKRSLRESSGGCVEADQLTAGPAAYPEFVQGDGDGWVISNSGAHYWGRYGAAGLLLRAPRPDGTPAVLLQHRAVWSHQGGTWALPGGARDSHETPEQTAVREAHEEAGLLDEHLEVRGGGGEGGAELPLHPGSPPSGQRLRTPPATVPLDQADARRQRLPRTLEI